MLLLKSGVLIFIASYATYVPTVSTTKINSAKEKDFTPKTAQEKLLKTKMVNTYIENDNYYKVTAA